MLCVLVTFIKINVILVGKLQFKMPYNKKSNNERENLIQIFSSFSKAIYTNYKFNYKQFLTHMNNHTSDSDDTNVKIKCILNNSL